MFWRLLGITIFIATMMAGCAAAPTAIESENVIGHRVLAGHTSNDGPVRNSDYVDGTHPNHIVQCRKEAPTGSRVRRTICEPKRDDSELFSLIGTGGPFNQRK